MCYIWQCSIWILQFDVLSIELCEAEGLKAVCCLESRLQNVWVHSPIFHHSCCKFWHFLESVSFDEVVCIKRHISIWHFEVFKKTLQELQMLFMSLSVEGRQ